jgi:ParB family chromosome partitioning protein
MDHPLYVVKDEDGPEWKGLGHPLPVRFSKLRPNPGQPRQHYSQKSLEALATNIQEEGQKTPVRAYRDKNEPGVFIIIAGERRWRAFQIIKERTGKEPIINTLIDTINGAEHYFREALIDNLHREDLCAPDEAAAYSTLHREHGMTIAAIAKMIDKSGSHVANYIKMHEALCDEVKEMLDPNLTENERLSVTSAIDIARSIPNHDLQLSVARESIERNLGVHEVKMLVEVRTGRSAYGIGGRLRKPSDDYKRLTSFLGRTQRDSCAFLEDTRMDINDLYLSRDSEEEDRVHDAAVVNRIILNFEKLLKKIEGKND